MAREGLKPLGMSAGDFDLAVAPDVREATAHFCRNGKHYLVTSGTTGYLPNPSEVAIADTWHGPYTVLGNSHVDDETNTSFRSQISCIFKVQGKKWWRILEMIHTDMRQFLIMYGFRFVLMGIRYISTGKTSGELRIMNKDIFD